MVINKFAWGCGRINGVKGNSILVWSRRLYNEIDKHFLKKTNKLVDQLIN